MTSTSLSLLRQAQGREPGGWERFQAVYEPLLRFWVERDPAARHEADDLVQDLLLKLHEHLPAFDRRRPGSFRRWLRTLATNRVREFLRKRRPVSAPGSLFEQLADPAPDLGAAWDAEYDRQVVARLLDLVRREVPERAWRLFERTEFGGEPARTAAERERTDVAAVYRARHQILARLRELGEELLKNDAGPG